MWHYRSLLLEQFAHLLNLTLEIPFHRLFFLFQSHWLEGASLESSQGFTEGWSIVVMTRRTCWFRYTSRSYLKVGRLFLLLQRWRKRHLSPSWLLVRTLTGFVPFYQKFKIIWNHWYWGISRLLPLFPLNKGCRGVQPGRLYQPIGGSGNVLWDRFGGLPTIKGATLPRRGVRWLNPSSPLLLTRCRRSPFEFVHSREEQWSQGILWPLRVFRWQQ